MPPSNAGRPRASAPETDPTLAGPGKAQAANVDQAAENAAGVDPSQGADEPGAGRTGGTFQGPTGAAGKEKGAENRTSVSADADVVRRDGPLGVKGDQAESAVVAESQRVDPPAETAASKGAPASTPRACVDSDAPLEAKRISDDVLSGPVAVDRLGADEGGQAEATLVAPAPSGLVDEAGSLSSGRQPDGLLAAAPEKRDDLKLIKGIGSVLEIKLNELGVFHFSQIADWTPQELIWVDNQLNFRGRALRDRWIEQARALVPAGRSAAEE